MEFFLLLELGWFGLNIEFVGWKFLFIVSFGEWFLFIGFLGRIKWLFKDDEFLFLFVFLNEWGSFFGVLKLKLIILEGGLEELLMLDDLIICLYMFGVIVFLIGNLIGEYLILLMFGVWFRLAVKCIGENFCWGNILLVSFLLSELLDFLLLILMFLLYISFFESMLLFFDSFIVSVVFCLNEMCLFLDIGGLLDGITVLFSLEYIWN